MDEVSGLMARVQMRREVITDDDQLIYLMDEISRGARRMYDARVARIGLNQTQWRIIGQLLRDPTLTQTEIAKKTRARIGDNRPCGRGPLRKRTDGES